MLNKTLWAPILGLALIGCGGKDDDGGTTTGGGKDDITTNTETGDTAATSAVDAGDTIEEALLLESSWSVGETKKIVAGVINPAGDRDFYALEGKKGDFFNFWTDAYINGSDCDTVIRVYDSDGVLIAENDDMAFRHQETDSASFFQLQRDGQFYIEIVEWSDWSPESAGVKGGSGYKYDLLLKQLDPSDLEPNDTIADADARWQDIVDYGYLAPIVYDVPDYLGVAALDFYGVLEPGDIDIWPLVVDTERLGDEIDGNFFQWSLWPGTTNDMRPRFTLSDSSGTILAVTEDPEVTPAFPWLYDAGITYQVEEGETYYLQVENLNQESLTQTYAGEIAIGYLPTNSDIESEGNDTQGTAMAIEGSLEASDDGTAHFLRIHGFMDDAGDVEWLKLTKPDNVTFEDRFLQVHVHAIGAGSSVDPKFTVYLGNSTEPAREATDWTAPGRETHPDPQINGFQLPSDDDIYIKIEGESVGPEERGNAWFLYLSVRDEAPEYRY